MKALTVILAAAFCLPALGLPTRGIAQDGSGDGETSGDAMKPPKPTYEQRKDGLYEMKMNTGGAVVGRRILPPEFRRLWKSGAITTIKANDVCRASVSSKPRRLTPGRSGMVKVLVTIGGDFLAQSGAHIVLELANVEGFTFGAPTLEPAKPSRKQGPFQGKPVHDDFLLFNVAVDVASSVKPQNQIYITGTVTLDLHDGKTGVEMGRFFADVVGRVNVGNPIAHVNPAKIKRSRRDPARGKDDGKVAAQAPGKTEPLTGAPGVNAEVGQGVMEATKRDAKPDRGVEASPTEPIQRNSTSRVLTWVFGSSVAVLLLLLMVAARRS